MLFATVSALGLAALAQAQQVHQIDVGGTQDTGIFRFFPNNVTAAEGDVINFRFSGVPGNHSVTQSSLTDPCNPLSGGFDSGWVLIPGADAGPTPEWNLTITNASRPLWFYCKQLLPAPHCGAGMVGAINANDSSIQTFMSNANGKQTSGQGIGALVGQGASASAPPSPISGSIQAFGVPPASQTASGSSPSGSGDSGSGSGSGDNGSASTVYASTLAALFAAVMGISLA
ncbi:hypothetical protein K435DRAFT_856570 [Dendrothele bispora CBS 962.96]|uniref:Cupredoxin n=1 Tax=Dendrothele bispora (strain CBS 962.96) TaxID=1314807 RepID=A0A4S8M9J9_DENBC|nr:hypothetical protein K435DRAFT_856570 [Dendrothele bispora CBS 962.96]